MNIICKPDIDTDPRVGRLPPHLYKLLSGLVRQAALEQGDKPWGIIAPTPLDYLAWDLHTYPHVLRRALPKLEALGLVETLPNGSLILPFFELCDNSEREDEAKPSAEAKPPTQSQPGAGPGGRTGRRAGETPSRATQYRWAAQEREAQEQASLKAAREAASAGNSAPEAAQMPVSQDRNAVSQGVSLTPESSSHSPANETPSRVDETKNTVSQSVSRSSLNVINVSEDLDSIAISEESGNVLTLPSANETDCETGLNETCETEGIEARLSPGLAPVPPIDMPALAKKLGAGKAELLQPQRRPAVQAVVQMTGDTKSQGNFSRLWTISRYYEMPEAWTEAIASTQAAQKSNRIRTKPGPYFNNTLRNILNKKLEPLGFYIPVEGKADAAEAAAAAAELRASWQQDAQTSSSQQPMKSALR